MTSPVVEPSIATDEQLLFLSNAHQQNVFYIKTREISLGDDDTRNNAGSLGCGFVNLYGDQAAKTPFTCTVSSVDNEVNNLLYKTFHVSSTYKDGRPVCVFETKDSSDEFRRKLSVRDDLMVDVSIVLRDSSSGTEQRSPVKTHIRFTPDVYLPKAQVVLTKDQPSTTIDVLGSSSQLTSLKVC